MSRYPLPYGNDWKTWARQLVSGLSSVYDNLSWKTSASNPSRNGSMLWDEEMGNVIVSKSGAWLSVSALANSVYVTEASQLTGTLSSDKIYVIDGEIDIGSDSINVPEDGLSIQGLGFGVSKIKTTATNATMFSYTGSYSGDLFIYGCDLEASGTGSKVFDLDNNGNFSAVECVDTNFSNCVSLGDLTDYRQGLWSNVALLFCTDGLTMNGTWAGGFRATTCIIIGSGFTGTVFKEGTSLVINGRIISDMNAASLNASGTFCDFQPSNITNDASFLMSGVTVNSAANAFPNMPASDTKARFSRCVGTDNTYVGGQWAISTEAATSCTANTPIKLAGTTTYGDMQWFSQTTDNAFVYDGADDIEVVVHVSLSYDGTNNDVIKTIIRKYDSSGASYSDVSITGGQTIRSGNRLDAVNLHGFTTLSTNDRIEIWVENDNSNNLTASLDGLVSVSERQS
jgi:hypothetical protein